MIRNVLFEDFKTVRVIKSSPTSVDDIQTAQTFRLDPIAPNPVRTETTIRYTLTASQHVNLDVYDNIGFHVATLVNGDQTPGDYQQAFVVNGLPSGTYMVQLRASGERRMQAMVVVR